MTVRNRSEDALPTSHVFFTISRGAVHRTLMARTGIVVACAAALPLLLVWLIGSTTYIAFHDKLVSALMLHERDMQYAYEDRIAALRSQLEREATKQLMAQRSIETKLDELAMREAELQTRSGVVAQLDRQVAGTAETVGGAASRQSMREASPAAPDAAVPAAAATDGHHASLSAVPGRVSSLAAAFELIATAQDDHLVRLGQKIASEKNRMREALSTAGLSVDRLHVADAGASGGPFVPLAKLDDGTPFGRSTVGLQLSLGEVERLRAAIAHVPFTRPLRGDPDITSTFGPRIDPFLGRPAMHTGLDLREETGTDVFVTAPGHVTFAGAMSGYGQMVEVDHGSGLATRYAHLSEITVNVGQTVKRGDVMGHVGATGRATGPHLHYETRIDGEAVDPMRFLSAGHVLFGDRDQL